MGLIRSANGEAGISRPINLLLTTLVALLITSAVAAEGGISDFFRMKGGTDIQTIRSLNLLIQRAYLSEAGSGITCTIHWAGQPAELRGYGSRSVLTLQTNINTDKEALGLQDPCSIIRSVHSNGTHLSIEYGVGMNDLTVPAGDFLLVIMRGHDGIRLELRL
ncbi:MAG: hypothetical protein WHS82_07800 [Candidatus Methanosuratincola sp.]